MGRKKNKLVKREVQDIKESLDYRSFGIRADSANAEKRTIRAAIATETPVLEYDWKRGERVLRVLLASGVVVPSSGQVPMLDTHSRYSVKSQLGSIRAIESESNEVRGTLHFSSAAEDAWVKVREGHVTDLSAGFEILAEEYVPRGETRKFDGKSFTGPINVATRWRLREGSLCPIGADEAAKMRGLDPAILNEKEIKVNPELRKRCVEAGMDNALSDAQAMEWLNANHSRVFTPKVEEKKTEERKEEKKEEKREEKSIPSAEEITRSVTQSVLEGIRREEELRQKQARDQREAFVRDVDATLTLVYGRKEDVPTQVQTRCLALTNMDEVRKYIGEEREKAEKETRVFGGMRISAGESQRDKHQALLRSAFMVRMLDSAFNGESAKHFKVEERAKGYEEFMGGSLIDLARDCLIADGYSWQQVRGLSKQDLAIAATGFGHQVPHLRSGGLAYHTTGSLSIITQDAINKTLLAGYKEAPQTWRGPLRQAASVPDFKQIHRIKMSSVANLPIWPDNSEPNQAALANEEEKYAVEARAYMLSFSWRLIVNDDMDAISRAPALLGAAAARTVNNVAWAAILANPTLADGQALFLETPAGLRFRSNYTVGSAVPTVATIGAMRAKMRVMRGLNTPEGTEGADILNLTPTYLVGPAALENTIMQLVMSTADPASGGNSGVYNPTRGLQPVIEPLLDVNSTTAFYLFCSPGMVDTAEVTFLQGQETPVTYESVNEKTLSRDYSIIQTYAAKAIDFRGMQKHKGAA